MYYYFFINKKLNYKSLYIIYIKIINNKYKMIKINGKNVNKDIKELDLSENKLTHLSKKNRKTH